MPQGQLAVVGATMLSDLTNRTAVGAAQLGLVGADAVARPVAQASVAVR
jgi:hypothetical protein